MDNLKPCPFCGGSFEVTHATETIDEICIKGVCKTCGMEFGYTQNFAWSNAGRIKLAESFEHLWNRRCTDKEHLESGTYEAAPVVHGRWVNEVELHPELYGWVPLDSVVCSVCNRANGMEKPYCPNCGARMVLEGE